jgi:hypothetical protein
MKKAIFVIAAATVCILLLWRCGNNSTETKTETLSTVVSTPPLPNPNIPGFNYPENRDTVNGWIVKDDTARISKHAWGVWTALTMPAGQKQDTSLLVFETWPSPADLIHQMGQVNLMLLKGPAQRSLLEKPDQFSHGFSARGELLRKNLIKGAININPDDDNVLVTVKYNPTAAQHIDSLKLLSKNSLSAMQAKGESSIPEFPNSAISLKPVYKVLIASDFNKGLYRLKVWTGPNYQPSGFDEDQWKGAIYIDTNNHGQGNGSVDTIGKITPQTTYNLNDFIHYRISGAQADSLNKQSTFSGHAKAGDFAVLVAMHVTTKETVRWTWQTFWWAPDPENPPLPSSKRQASYRPAELHGAARHYALATAYTYILPDQPLSGGTNIGKSVIGFNPYLEASFYYKPGDTTAALIYPALVITDKVKVFNNVGVLTNCMSCHALTNYPITGPDNYLGDTYIDTNTVILKGKLKTDFLWSIPRKAVSTTK